MSDPHPVKLDRHLSADPVPSLDDLAATANREHEACEASLGVALDHAIAAGEALQAAQAVIPYGEWLKWLAANFRATPDRARVYIRIATYRDRLTEPMSIRQARTLVAGLPETRSPGPPRQYPAEDVERAVRLVKSEGLTIDAAAAETGVSPHVLRRARTDPRVLRARRKREGERRYAAKIALRKVERDKAIRAAVRKAGEALSEAYSMSARMAKVLAQAEAEATTDEARAALADATAHYHKMSDAIVRALGVS